jgi:two-component system, response regulator
VAEALPAVLVIEDSPEDFEATRRSLLRGGLANPIVHLADGDRALDYLFPTDRSRGAARAPGLILLDLNLPGTDGRQVLSRLKADERLRQVPVVVLTTSRDERDVRACYRAGANSYIQKPVDLSGFQRALRMLREYWFDVVVLPSPE